MNKSEKDNLKLIEYQVEQIFIEIKAIKQSNDIAHKEVKDDLRFIKNNLFVYFNLIFIIIIYLVNLIFFKNLN